MALAARGGGALTPPPRVAVLVFDGVGHFPAREAPDAVAAALASHLARHESSRLR